MPSASKSKNETAFKNLAEDVGKRGEVSRLARKSGVLHGRCLKFGEGLEVWTVLYESGTGEMFYTDCRPGFRARYSQTISPWILTEFDEEGEAVIHGFIEGGHRSFVCTAKFDRNRDAAENSKELQCG